MSGPTVEPLPETFREIPVAFIAPPEYKGRVAAVVGQIGPLWGRGWHAGTDILLPEGTDLYAGKDGRVRLAGDYNGKEGRMVSIESDDEEVGPFQHLYFHMSEINVAIGDIVKIGQFIGLSGKTGHVQGPHCHFQLQKYTNGKREFFKPRWV